MPVGELNKNIKLLLDTVYVKNIIKDIDIVRSFCDEPKIFFYSAALNLPNKSETASGLSFQSRGLALYKCLIEAIERYSLINFEYKINQYSIYKMGNDENINFPTNRKVDLSGENEEIINKDFALPNTSTGAAGGFDHTSTLLRGMYEVIERDSFMTMFLGKIKAPMVNLRRLNNKTIDSILETNKRYGLEVAVFDITNDLEVPTFLSITIDRTGIGPAITCGLKTDFNIDEAIIGSITESFITRRWIRETMIKNNYVDKNINPKRIKTFKERGLYWSSIKNLQKLEFLLNQKPKLLIRKSYKKSDADTLSKLRDVLAKKGHKIFYIDITHSNIRDTGYVVYRVIIPSLQPLYFSEIERKYYLRKKRIKDVANYFGIRKYSINDIPHPFI